MAESDNSCYTLELEKVIQSLGTHRERAEPSLKPYDATMLQMWSRRCTFTPDLVKRMSLPKAIVKNSRIWEGFKSITLILFLVLYIASGTGYGLFHEHQSFVSHSAEEENDPCHRAIYHIEKDNACKHESHVSRNEKCCDGHLLFHTDQMVVRSALAQSVSRYFVIKVILTFPHLEEIFLYHPSRAPPLA